jgi:S-adenosylmethionine decarboxylase
MVQARRSRFTHYVLQGDALVIGEHLLIDMYGVEPVLLADVEFLRRVLVEATEVSGLQPVAAPVVLPFAPRPDCPGPPGITGFVLLAESHIALHTYPEHGFAGVDVFTCGAAGEPRAVLRVFRERLSPTRLQTVEYARGEEV